MLLLCSIPGDIGSFSKMTIEIGWNRSVLEEEVRNRTKFENRRVLVPMYADDSSSSISDPNIEELATSMKLQYSSISSFLTASLLKVNDSKTHTMLLTTAQLRRQRNLNMTVEIGSVRQKTSPVERLLGLQLHQNLKFREHRSITRSLFPEFYIPRFHYTFFWH